MRSESEIRSAAAVDNAERRRFKYVLLQISKAVLAPLERRAEIRSKVFECCNERHDHHQ